jgi:arginase
MPDTYIVTPFYLDEYQPQLERLAGADWRLNRPEVDGESRFSKMASIHRPLADFVKTSVEHGDRPVCIGGDCCAAIGVLAGLQNAGIQSTLLWLDAHGDFNTYETTLSGFVGGMPLAMIVGRGDQTLIAAAGLKPLPESVVFLSDARNLDPGEGLALHASHVHHVVDAAKLPNLLPSTPLYVHLDVDVINPQDAPAVHYPTPGGPSLKEMCEIARALAMTRQIIAVSVTVWDFEKENSKETEWACMQVVSALVVRPSHGNHGIGHFGKQKKLSPIGHNT